MIIKLQILTDLSAFLTLHPSTLEISWNYNLYLLIQRAKASIEFGPILKLKTRPEYNCSFEPQDRTDWRLWPLTQPLNTLFLQHACFEFRHGDPCQSLGENIHQYFCQKKKHQASDNRGENQTLVGAIPFCGEYPGPRFEDKFRSANQID